MPLLDFTGTFGLWVAGCDVSEVRIAGMGGRWERRVNLATNPSFEATSGTVVVRTNLCTTPASYTPAADGPYPGLGAGPYTASAEIGGMRQAVDPLALVGGVTYERLLIEAGSVPLGPYFDGNTRPVLRTNLAEGWEKPGFAYQYATQTSSVRVPEGRKHTRLTATAVTYRHPFRYVPGATYTVAFRLDKSDISVRLRAAEQPDTTGVNETTAWPVSLGGGRYYATMAAPVGAPTAQAGVYLYSASGAVGEVVTFCDVDIYDGPYDPAREFVAPGQRDSTGLLCEWSGPVNASPSVVMDPDFTPAWTGPVGASTSVLRGQVIADCISNSANPVRVASTRWKASGERSLRISARNDSSDSFCERRTPLPPGRTYRVSATCHLWQPQSGSVSARARGIMLYGYRRLPDGTYETVSSPRTQAPNETGSHRVSVVWAVPSDVFTATNFATPGGVVRLYNGGSIGGGDVWWDDLTIEDITDATPTHDEPFHGDTPDTPDALYRWHDVPHASPTTAYYAWQPV